MVRSISGTTLPTTRLLARTASICSPTRWPKSTYGVVADAIIDNNAIENSSYTLALVETASLTGSTVSGSETALDAVGVTDGETAESFFFDAPVLGPDDGGFFPAGLRRVVDGVDTDTAADWSFLDFFNGAPNDPTSGGTRVIDEPDVTLISAIQGAGAATPLAGQTVTVEAVVTQVSGAIGGFFVQEEGADYDGDAATSEGLFVFNGFGDVPAEVGDLVRVTGTISEFFSLTQMSAASIEVVPGEYTVPESVEIRLPLPEGTDPLAFYETLEGMQVSILPGEGDQLTVTDTFTSFGEVGVTSGDPLLQPTQVFESFSPEQEALAEANARNYLLFEDGDNDDLSSAPRAGDGIVGDRIDGAMYYSFGDYKVETTGPLVEFDPAENPNPRIDEPDDVGGRLTVASFNVLNYFTTLTSEDSFARGAETPQELADQTAKIVAALIAIDADVLGLIEIENDLSGVPDEAVAALVEALNAVAGAGTYDYVATGQVGTDAIKQAILYKPSAVTPSGDFAVLDTDAFVAPYTPGDPQSRPAIAQTFEEVATGEKFTVTVNHLKSKGSTTGAVIDGEPDDNPVEGSAALTRVAAAQELAAWLETDPTGQGDDDYLIIGDLNAYAMERAIQALQDEGYTNLIGSDGFSYQFDGRFGTLDYAMANEAILDQVIGATVWHPNSLEAYSIQYDGRDFEQFGSAETPYASSDHDPVIVGLDLKSEPELPIVLGKPGSGPVKGTAASEILDGQGGRLDVARGMGGDDVFRFVNTDEKRDGLLILDYAEGDRVDLSGEVVNSSRVLGNNLKIVLEGDDGDYIFVHGVDDIDEITFYDDLVVA